MKIINNKNIFLTLIFFVILMASAFGYYTFNSYSDYIKTEKNIKDMDFIVKSDMILKSVAKERIDSAIYMGSKEKSNFKKVEVSRVNVDDIWSEFATDISANGTLKSYRKRADFIVKNLKFVRTKIDTLNDDYENIFFDFYHKNIVMSIVGGIETITRDETSSERQTYKEVYMNLLKLRENIALENAMISFFINDEKQMSNEDFKAWDTLMSKQLVPQFKTIDDKKIVSSLKDIFKENKFESIALKERVGIFTSAVTGEYTLSAKEWLSINSVKFKMIISGQEILINAIKKSLDNSIEMKKNILTKYALGFLLSLILLLILTVIYYNINKDKQLFEDTLKDIESVLNLEQQKELKYLVDNRETNRIYKFLADTIREANEAKDLFLANMSHEIRTPLNGVVGFTQLLKNTEISSEQEEFISIIEHSSDNLLSIVNDILDFSKIRANQIELEYISFDPLEEFESTVETYGARASEKNIALGVYIDPNIPTALMGDSTKISQILTNLLSNAIKFTDMNGSVDISIVMIEETKTTSTLKFMFTDTGIGITKEQQNKIFNEFSQADASTSRKFGGTGLGLAISSKFVSVMGGQLEISSKKGEGSTFFFTLSLDKVDKNIERIKIKKPNINIGYLVPNKDIDITMQENLKHYTDYLGSRFTVYEENELLDIDSDKLPDLLFINHRYCKLDNELDSYLALDVKTVLMTTGSLKTQLINMEDQIDKIVYQPMNFTKVVSSFELFNVTSKSVPQKANVDEGYIQFNNIHALVAEDNLINQKLIQSVLQGFGIIVTLVNNGFEALQMRKENNYDVIFMDIQMPVMGGIESTREILDYEEKQRKHHIPIIALTANALAGDREKYINEGMDNYLSKPFDLEKISLLLKEYFPRNLPNDEKIHRVETVSVEVSREVNRVKIDTDKVLEENGNIEKDNKEIERKVDILLYHSHPLIINIYASKLKNLGYSVDTVGDEHILLDRVEDTQYSFVIYGRESLDGMECMIADIIRDSGAKPYILIDSIESDKECCADILDMTLTSMGIKEILV